MALREPRLEKFAKVLVEEAAEIEEGDNVYILSKSLESLPLFKEVRKQVIKKGAFPHEHLLFDSQLSYEGADYDWYKYTSEEQLRTLSEVKMKEMEMMDAYIRIGGGDNAQDLNDIGSEKISIRRKATRPLMDERFKKKWVTTRYPTSSMAQKAGMSTEKFEEFILTAVNETDWDELERKNQRIKQVFDGAKEVRITGEATELKLSLKNREGVNSSGNRNIPDGEVFYAPVKDSLEGKIAFSYPGVESGNEVSGIKLRFKNGKIVDYSAERNQEFLEKMIETDRGSRYIGEFGIGTNRQIEHYVKETMIDEKIGGTIHLAIGNAYERSLPEGVEGNSSGVHWDLIKDLRPRDGGGKIFADGELVQKDGEWVF